MGGNIARFISHNDLGRPLFNEAKDFMKKCDTFLDVQQNTQNKANIQREWNKQAKLEELLNIFQNENNEDKNSL